MWWKGNAFVVLLMITGFLVCHSASQSLSVEGGESFGYEELDKNGGEKNSIDIHELENREDTESPIIQAGKNVLPPETVKDEDEDKAEEIQPNRRTRRQLPTTATLELVSQQCDGITLGWIRPNIPFSLLYHSTNPEFSHYNIYRQTSYFTSIAGLMPLASGKDHPELQTLLTNKWIDKFPPTGTSLFYAITVVDHRGKETPTVVPKQISFFGSIEKTGINPTLIIPNVLKGDVLHHSLAYNNFRNEYMVAFDLDVNKDGSPDHVYALRLNDLGQIVDGRILNASVGMVTTQQGRPSVAFNPTTQQYLIAFQLSAPSLFGGNSIIIGQLVAADKTDRFQSPYIILKGTKDGSTFVPTVEPTLIYNSGSGGFAMSAMLVVPPKTAFAVFLKSDGKTLAIKRLFHAEVFDINVFMDSKNRQVYFVYQVAQFAANVVDPANAKSSLTSNPYLIVVTKTDATGTLLNLNDPTTTRNLVGYSREKNSNIAGYLHQNTGWLTVFWNNKENGKKIISSSNILGIPGSFMRVENANTCPTQAQVENPAACFLPNNDGHILLWEEGSQLGGFLVKDDTFPVRPLGEQRQPKLVYNQGKQRAFAVWKQKFAGSFVLFVRHVHPGTQFTCRVACKSTEKCAMKNTCAPRNPGAIKNIPTCGSNKGGCSHTCSDNPKGRTCSCPWTYSLALDKTHCFLKVSKPDVSLLYSSEDSVWSVSVYYKEKRATFTKVPIQGKQIIAFFYNTKDKYLYWGDASDQKIYRAFLDGSNKMTVINNGVLLPDGMVVDPNAKQLYWSDATLGLILRSSLDGNKKTTFVPGLDKPRTLVLHQLNKWLFWTSWGTVAKIERINIDGSGRKTLFDTGLTWPNGLAIDGSSLYWADAKLDKIEKSDLNGQNRVLITKKGVPHAYGLGIAGNMLFWTDWSGNIFTLDKSNPHSSPVAVVTGIKKPFTLQIYDGTAVNKASFCTDPGVPRHGGRNPPPGVGGKYKIGDRVILTCNPGFVHLGSGGRRCLSTGKWTGVDTQCKALPVFIIRPSNKTVDPGASVTLVCSAEIAPGVKAVIQWHKDGKIIPPSLTVRYFKIGASGFFFISNVLAGDTGTYTCVASNAAGNVRASMYLLVNPQVILDCGKAKFSTRAKIIGGQRATHGSIPWQALLFNKRTNRPFCGGSLLNERWVITAAHCVGHASLSETQVVLGEHNWAVDDKTEQRLDVDQIHQHAHYNQKTFDSDIALIRLQTKVIMNDYVKPVCLPFVKSDLALLKARSIGHISGWGARKANKSRPVKRLHEVRVPLVSQVTCVKSHPTFIVTSNMFCAGDATGKSDACQGDSGGPLTVVNKITGRSILLGLVSWGDKCGVKNKYGVYTKIPNYINWINNHIKNM